MYFTIQELDNHTKEYETFHWCEIQAQTRHLQEVSILISDKSKK